jgi:hypothetical protein
MKSINRKEHKEGAKGAKKIWKNLHRGDPENHRVTQRRKEKWKCRLRVTP